MDDAPVPAPQKSIPADNVLPRAGDNGVQSLHRLGRDSQGSFEDITVAVEGQYHARGTSGGGPAAGRGAPCTVISRGLDRCPRRILGNQRACLSRSWG